MESLSDQGDNGVEADFSKNPFYQAVLRRLQGTGEGDTQKLAAMRLAIEQGVRAADLQQASTMINTLTLAEWFAIFFLQRYFARHHISAACAEEAMKEANNTAERRHQSQTPIEELVGIRELALRMRAQSHPGA